MGGFCLLLELQRWRPTPSSFYRRYYLHTSRDSVSPVCSFFLTYTSTSVVFLPPLEGHPPLGLPLALGPVPSAQGLAQEYDFRTTLLLPLLPVHFQNTALHCTAHHCTAIQCTALGITELDVIHCTTSPSVILLEDRGSATKHE